jgi:heme exporter protein A
MLTAANLACTRGERRLFAGLAFAIEAGGWIHVTGENGSGKTSLLRILCGLSQPEAGEIRWNGVPIRELDDEYRKILLYLGHQTPVKEEFTARENLRIAAAVAGTVLGEADADRALEQVGLGGRERLPVRFLSQGQKRRVALARLLTSPAPLWILDEPFVALDTSALAMLTGIIADHLAGDGIAVLTSHQEVTIATAARLTLRIAA